MARRKTKLENNLERYGKIIRHLRAEEGLSIRELADRAGIPHMNLQRIEKGGSNSKIGTYDAIFEALGVGTLFDFAQSTIDIEELPEALRQLAGQLEEILPSAMKLSILSVGLKKKGGK